MANDNPYRALARRYHNLGFNVIPLGDDKRPVITGLTQHGKPIRLPWDEWQARRQSERNLSDLLRPAWWTDVRGVAGVCGLDGLVCIDFDLPKDINGEFPLAHLTTFAAQLDLPDNYAWLVQTPRGGYHVWLRAFGLALPGGDKGKLDRPARNYTDGTHIELRYTGHYAALPGSLHPTGRSYEFMTGATPETPPPAVDPQALLAAYMAVTQEPPAKPARERPAAAPMPAPDAATREAAYASSALHDEAQSVAQAPQGSRNDQLNESAFALGQLVAGGLLERAAVEDALRVAALAAGLDEGETERTLASGLEDGLLLPRTAPPPSTNGNGRYADGFAPVTPDPAALGEDGADGADDERDDPSWPYAVKEGRLVYMVETKDDVAARPICDFTATVTGDILEEEGGRTFVIQGATRRGRPFRAEVAAEQFGDDRKLRSILVAAAGSLDPIYARMGEHVRPAIQKVSRRAGLTTTHRYRRTGWLPNPPPAKPETPAHFLLPGRAHSHTDGEIEIHLDRKLPYGLTEDADPDAGLQALTDLLDCIDPAVAAPVLALLLQAPLHRLAFPHARRYAMFVEGRTGSLKTSFTQTAMTIYGPRFSQDELLVKWGEGATRNAIMSLAAHAHDLPFLIDNYKPNTGGGSRDFINLIHNILEGGDKLRQQADGQMRPSHAIHCLPIITGEDVPDNDAAAVARILIVQFPFSFGQTNLRLAAAQAASEHLQTVGAAWLDWLELPTTRTAARELGAQLRTTQAAWRDDLVQRSKGSANVARVAETLAANDLAWQFALTHPVLGPVLAPYTQAHQDGLRTMAQTMASRTAEALEAHQFISTLAQLITTRQYVLVPRQQGEPSDLDRDRMLGWADDQGVYLLPQIALAAVRRNLGPHSIAVSPQGLYSQLDGLGMLASKGTKESAKIIKVAGRTQRVMHLKREHLLPEGDEETNDLLQELGL